MRWERRLQLGWVSPEVLAYFPDALTGRDVVATGLRQSFGLMSETTPAERRKAMAWLRRAGSLGLARKLVTEMSYGEFRLVLLLRALVHDPKVVLLDEPLDGLDAVTRKGMVRLLLELMQRNVSLVAVSHRVEELPHGFTHHCRLAKGRIVSQHRLDE